MRICDWSSDVCSPDLPLPGIDGAFPGRLIFGMILARRLAECHFRSGLVLPLRQNVAPFHLDRLAQPPRRLAGFRQRQQLGAAQPYIMPLAVALQSQEPRGSEERKSVV